ncbi:Glycosyl hydrolase [Cupriavidus oxalaticus]|uniref:WD40/YVTN/BNR-like repeat-containing protein n=1 Tax=Cupriavidus oxalaticus TaxID=96344 RepID=UPI003F73450A
MNNASESLNRYTVRFFAGSFEHDLIKRFEQFGQNATWWVSPDWKVIYIATTWTDYKQDNGPDGYGMTYHKLWKSIDGGLTWNRLSWPEGNNISQIAFLDANRGYAIGWGPHIWRTADGGQHWEEVKAPALAYRIDADQTRAAQVKAPSDVPVVRDARFTFSSASLADNGVLFLAFFAPEPYGGKKHVSLVYALRWNDPADIFVRADRPRGAEMAIPEATVMDTLWVPETAKGLRGNALYLLTEQGLPHNHAIPHDSDRKRPAGIWRWTGTEPKHLKTFSDDISPAALYSGRDGLLMIDASSSRNEHDIALISRDGGESWEQQDEGPGAAGGHFESGGATKWRYFGYTLYSREIR